MGNWISFVLFVVVIVSITYLLDQLSWCFTMSEDVVASSFPSFVVEATGSSPQISIIVGGSAVSGFVTTMTDSVTFSGGVSGGF